MNQLDPMVAAMEATAEVPNLFGEVYIDAYFVRLTKGEPKEPFDEQSHDPAHRRTEIKIGISPLPETGVNFIYERNFIAEFSNDGWLKVTLPSLKALDIAHLNELDGKWVQAKAVKFGSYKSRQDGQVKDKTAPEIVAVYDSIDECLSAWEAETGSTSPRRDVPKDETPEQLNEALFGKTGGTKPAANGNNGAQKSTAQAFLPALVKSCRQGERVDTDKLADTLGVTPLVKDYFTVQSPEVQAIIKDVEASPAF